MSHANNDRRACYSFNSATSKMGILVGIEVG